MNRLFFALCFFFALTVFAQEMDTTYVLNEKGETIGIIHAKGTNPFVAAPAVAPVTPAAESAEESAAPVAAPQPTKRSVYSSGPAAETIPLNQPLLEDDSTAYYQGLVDHYTASGNKLRKVGKGLMLGGGIGLGAGAMLMVAALADDDLDNAADAAAFLTGYIMVLAAPEVFATGLVLKIVGSSRLRKGERYEDKLNSYRVRNSVTMSAVPIFNPLNGAVGGAMALNF